MGQGFIQVELEQMSFMAYQPWLRRGWRHGFTGIDADFSSIGLATWVPKLLHSFDIRDLWLIRQAHGDQIIDLNMPEQKNRERLRPLTTSNFEIELALVGDALIIHTSESRPVAIGVRTADCVPVFVRYGAYCAVIHAGWRGLASGIITKTIYALMAKQNLGSSSELLDIVIGPCAGPQTYEVGPEVIEALGSKAVYASGRPGGYLLDLVATARSEIESLAKITQSRIGVSGVCTITDPSYHSYRRSQGISGSNLSFIVC